MTKGLTFVNFSGGLDSTYFVLKWLQRNKGNGEKLLIHHCLYSKRQTAEQKASEGVIRELKSMGLTNFIYETSHAKFTKKPDRDIIVMAAMGALVSRAHQITRVMLTYSREESSELDIWLRQRGSLDEFNAGHRYSIANRVYQTIYRKNKVEFYLPEQKTGLISRDRMIAEMPDQILKWVSFCRNPQPGRRVCGKCFTCNRTVKFLNQQNKMHLCIQQP